MPIALRADYENANGRMIAIDDGPVVRFEAEARGGRWPLWWRFWLTGLPRFTEVRLELANAADVLGGLQGLRHVRPVWREPAGHWRRVECMDIDEAGGVFGFVCATSVGEIEVAFCHPFSYSDLRTWIEGLPDTVTGAELCVSPGGLSVPLLRMGDPRGARHGVWITARQHAGEAPGSWVLNGLVQHFLDEGASPDHGIALNIVPMIDVDGVFRGDYGKTVAPDDFWEDWRGASRRAAVGATRAAIAEWAAERPYDLLLDLHAPTPSDGSYAYGIPAPNAELQAARNEFLAMVEETAPADCPFDAEHGRMVSDEELIARSTQGAQMAEHGVLAICLETAYHRTSAGTWVTPGMLQRLGRAVGEATVRYLSER